MNDAWRSSWLQALGVLLVAAAYWTASCAAGSGDLIPPLDDTFIHLQYARNLASGDLFAFNPGGPYSTGDTSPLYVVLLAPAFWLGLDGTGAMWWVFLVNALIHFGVVALGAQLVARGTESAFGRWTGLAMLLFWGPWAWGVYLGMEVGLTALLLLVVLLGDRAGDSAPERRWAIARLIALVALPLVRPEGLFLAALAITVQTIGGRGDFAAKVRKSMGEALTLVPFFAYLAVNAAATGSARTAGYIVKAVSEDPGVGLFGAIGHIAGSVVDLLRDVFFSTSFEYLPPLALIWLVLALGPRIATEWRVGRTPAWTLIAVWWVADLGLVAMAWFPDVHRARYLLPLFPLYVVVFALFAGDLARRLGDRGRLGLVGVLIALAVGANGVRWVDHYYSDAHEIASVQVRLAHWIDAELPEDTIVGLHDAGALAYLSGRQSVDIVGLGTLEFARPFRHGQGSVMEQIERLPEERRPDVFVTCPSWFQAPILGDVIARASIPRAEIIPQPVFLVYEADYSVFDSAGSAPLRPDLPEGWEVVAEIDVADLESEAAALYNNAHRDRLMQHTNMAEAFTAAGARYADGGRLIFRGEQMTVSVRPNAPFAVVGRVSDGGGGAVSVSVHVTSGGDGEIGLLELPDGQSFGEPAALFEASQSEQVTLTTWPSDGNAFKSFHYWILQPAR